MKPALRRAYRRAPWCRVLAGSFATTVAAADPSTTTMTIDLQGHAAQVHHPFTLTATVAPTRGLGHFDATIAFVDADGSGVGCAAALSMRGATRRPAPSLCGPPAPTTSRRSTPATRPGRLGERPHHGRHHRGSGLVEAHAVGVSAGSIYPVKDGYRDTVTLSGHRDESIAVTISIYNSSNKRVRLATKSSATGAYSYVWNGRDSKGAVLPAGKYRVVQKLVDTSGTTKSFTAYVNLSTKKLVTVTKTITKKDPRSPRRVARSPSPAPRPQGRQHRRLGGWQFKIPSAVIYKSLWFRVDASARLSAPASSSRCRTSTCAASGTPAASTGSRASGTRLARPSGTRQAARLRPSQGPHGPRSRRLRHGDGPRLQGRDQGTPRSSSSSGRGALDGTAWLRWGSGPPVPRTESAPSSTW